MLCASPSWAVPIVRGFGASDNHPNTATTCTPPLGGSEAAGDIDLLVATLNGQTATPSCPSGYTIITAGSANFTGTNSGQQVQLLLCQRAWQSGDGAPTLTYALAGYNDCRIIDIQNANTTVAAAANIDSASYGTFTATSPATSVALTLANANDLLLVLAGGFSGSLAIAGSPATTNLYVDPATNMGQSADKLASPSSPTTAYTYTSGGASVAVQVAYLPASAATLSGSVFGAISPLWDLEGIDKWHG